MLWIITQNNSSLVNIKEVTVKGRLLEGVLARGFFNEWSNTLGKYDSNDRAKEVLSDIYGKINENSGGTVTYQMPDK